MQSILLELITIDRRSTIEFNIQLKESIKSLILDKTFYYHTILPTPNELAEFLQIKERLVIKTYEQLQTERYIQLNKDKNYIVSFFELTNHFFDRNTTVHEAIISLGLKPSIKCLEKKVVTLDFDTINKMGFDANQSHDYLYINRIYFGDLQPIMILENYLPLYIFPDLSEKFKGDEPLDKYLKSNYGIGNSTSKRIIKSVNLDERLAIHLNEAKNAPSIQSTNQIYDKYKRLIDYGRSHTISSYYFQALITRQEMDKYLDN